MVRLKMKIVLALGFFVAAFSGVAHAEFKSLGKVSQVTQAQINLACSHRFKLELTDTTGQLVQVLYYPVTRTDSSLFDAGWFYNFSAPIVGVDTFYIGYDSNQRISLKQAAYGRKFPSHITASFAPAGETSSFTLDVNSIGSRLAFTPVANIPESALQDLTFEQNCAGS
jgi:hypothetical protein